MERANQVSGTAGLARQPGKMINLICEKISGHMELSQPAFTIHTMASQAG